MIRNAKKTRAIISALALTLALAGPTLGVSQSASETLTVQSQITITGVPASLAYGSTLGGTTLTAPTFQPTVSTNNPTGYKFEVLGTALARTGGGGTIDVSNRIFHISGGALTCTPAAKWSAGSGGAYAGSATAAETICTSSAPTAGAGDVFTVASRVAVPAGAVPGAYTGTVTFSATANL